MCVHISNDNVPRGTYSSLCTSPGPACVPRILEPDNAIVSSGNRGLPAFRHATRFSAFVCGRSPDVRQLLIPSVAILCFGLKTIVKSDPIPKPTKRNVIAEYKSYPLSFLAPSIRPLSMRKTKYETANHFMDCMNR